MLTYALGRGLAYTDLVKAIGFENKFTFCEMYDILTITNKVGKIRHRIDKPRQENRKNKGKLG